MHLGIRKDKPLSAFTLPSSLPLFRTTLLRQKKGFQNLCCSLPPKQSSSSLSENVVVNGKSRNSDSRPVLPASSWHALKTAVALTATGFSVPCILALRETLGSDDGFFLHLSTYASHFEILLATIAFGSLHSGLASLRPWLASRIGERLYRVGFALASIPSAVALITFFVAHRYDGALLWSLSLQSFPQIHTFVYVTTFISFLFLYPATYNLLEVAAVQRPSFRIYESGITRISRHPQLTGQILWCLAHTAWIGSSFTLVTSLALVAHHCFGAWNGDRRLRDRYGAVWRAYADRTSIFPFAAMISGKQPLVLNEFIRPAYLGIIITTLAFYAAHPIMYRAVAQLHW